MSLKSQIKTILDTQGESITYSQVTAQTRSATTLKKTNTLTAVTINGHVRRFNDSELQGLVQQGDRELRVAADEITFVPQENDRVTVAGQVFNVKSIDRRTINGVNALYIMRIRGNE